MLIVLLGKVVCWFIYTFFNKQYIFFVLQGMVLVSPESSPFACIEFDANIYVLFHAKHISTGFQTTIHVGNVRQTVKIVRMDKVS